MRMIIIAILVALCASGNVNAALNAEPNSRNGDVRESKPAELVMLRTQGRDVSSQYNSLSKSLIQLEEHYGAASPAKRKEMLRMSRANVLKLRSVVQNLVLVANGFETLAKKIPKYKREASIWQHAAGGARIHLNTLLRLYPDLK